MWSLYLPMLCFSNPSILSSSQTLLLMTPSDLCPEAQPRSRGNNHTLLQDTNKTPNTSTTRTISSLLYSSQSKIPLAKCPKQLNLAQENRTGSPWMILRCRSMITHNLSSPTSQSVCWTLSLTARTWRRSAYTRARTQGSSSRSSVSSSTYLITRWRSSWNRLGTRSELTRKQWEEARSINTSNTELKWELFSNVDLNWIISNKCVKLID